MTISFLKVCANCVSSIGLVLKIKQEFKLFTNLAAEVQAGLFSH